MSGEANLATAGLVRSLRHRRRQGTASAAIERRSVRLGPVTLSYGHAGAGPPVVLIHGLGGSGRWWAKNIGPLAERYEIHVVDLVGFGESHDRQRFALAEASHLLASLLEQLEVGPATLIGHSMGGYIAAELAADTPDRVSRLVLVDAAMLPDDFVSPRQVLNLMRTLPRLPARFIPVLAADVHRAGTSTMVRATWELLTADLQPKLSRIQIPTLIVWGGRDRVVPLAAGHALVAQLSDARLAVIPDAGHMPMWERPESFNRLVLDFLAEGGAGARHPTEEAPCPPG